MQKRRLFKLVTLIGVPILALAGAEVLLSALDYRTTYEREDPFLGFASVSPLFEKREGAGPSGEAIYVSRESKLPWFNHQEFRAEKPSDGFRVFAFGGSTTFGRPYDHRTAFPNWLEVLLRASDPSTEYEVVNAGGVSYASYRIIHLMNEMVEYEPDLFVVYTGHNEFLEDRTYSEIREESPVVTRLRTVLHRSRSYSLARDVWLDVRGREREEAEEKFEMSGEVTAILDQSFGLEQYRRDPEKEDAILRHFRYNLEKMVQISRDRGVPLVFVVPPSNEKDFSPFKSETCATLRGRQRRAWTAAYEEGRARLERGDPTGALEAFRRAAGMDGCHADLWYRTGRALFALGRHDEAKEAFVRARDRDVAPLRSTSRIQQAVRQVAREHDVPAIDLVAMLEARVREEEGHDILGDESFLDHAHPRIWVHQLVAEKVAELFQRRDWVDYDRPVRELRTAALYDSVMATVDSSYYAVRDLNLAKVLSWLGKREEAEPFVARAAEGLPEHPEAQYLRGVFLQEEGRFGEAVEAYERAIALDETFGRAYTALSSVYERTGQLDAALASIRQAVRYQPEADNAYFSLGNILYRKERSREAIRAYEKALELNPRHSRAWNNLAAVHITEGEYEEAIDALERTLELEPGNFNAYKNLGLSYYNTGQPERAREMFTTVLEIRPDDEFARRWLRRLDQETTP